MHQYVALSVGSSSASGGEANRHMIRTAIGEQHDGRHSARVGLVVEKLDALHEAVPQISLGLFLHSMDDRFGERLVVTVHGDQLVEHL